MLKIFFSFLILSFYTTYADDEKNNYPSLRWVTSIEYSLLCSQVYQSAQQEFEKLNLFSVTSVTVEQKNQQKLPLAIITDIDETILLNYGLQQDILKNKIPFSYKLFKKHIDLGEEIPINGSINYFQYLAKKGVKIIYISNRSIEVEEQTYRYLKRHGYPIVSKDDLLLKNEHENWTKDKSSRRAYISKRYTVIQIFGDNIKDFVQKPKDALNYKNKFGESWFLLPNPIYGNWLK